MSEENENKVKEGIATDVLIYLDNRFESIKSAQENVNSALFKKLDEISSIVTENLIVAKTQNSRIYKLEKKHENCPGAEALANAKIKDAVDHKAEEFISDKRWIIGKTLKDWSVTLAAITAIITGIVLISKHIVL
jgi:hypothetical protein